MHLCSCQKLEADTQLVTAKRFHGSTDHICTRLLIFLLKPTSLCFAPICWLPAHAKVRGDIYVINLFKVKNTQFSDKWHTVYFSVRNMKWFWKKLSGLKEPFNQILWIKNVLFTRPYFLRNQNYTGFWSSRDGEYLRWYPVRGVLSKRDLVTVQRHLTTVTRCLHYHSYIPSDKKRREMLPWMNKFGARGQEAVTQFGVPYELLWTDYIFKAYIHVTFNSFNI